MSTTPTVTIDGRPVVPAPGDTVLTAARRIGIAIPTLCHDPVLVPEATCRVCCVEIEGWHGLLPACSTAPSPGMVVHTASATVLKNRRLILELVLDGFGRVEDDDPAREAHQRLLVMARDAGLDTSRPAPAALAPRYLSHHDAALAISPERCIQCGNCFRYCEYLHGFHPSRIVDVGARRRLSFALGISLEAGQCDHCGNCVDHCPTGALLERWQVQHGPAEREAPSVCTYCGTGCALMIQVKNDRVIGARPAARDATVNQGELCVKGRFGFGFAGHPERLTAPLIRIQDGHRLDCFRRATWDEALDLVAAGFAEIKKNYGGDSLAVLSSARATNEENYLAQKLARAVFGTNNVDNCARVCHAPSVVGLTAAFGSGAATNSLDEIPGADCIVVVGANPTEAHPVIGHKIKDAVYRRGCRLVVIDPRRIWLTQIADVHLPLRPGTNIALVNGLLRVLLEENLVNRAFVAERTEGFDKLEQLIRSDYPLERVASLTGVAPESLRAAARLYAEARHGMILYGLGVTEHIHGSANVMALANLALATGHVGRPHTGVNPLRGQNNVQGACDVGALPNVLPGYQRLDDPAVVEKFSRRWGVAVPPTAGLKSCQMFHGAVSGRVRGLYIIAEDPAQTEPDSLLLEKALASLDFLVVQELFFTRTAAYADVILPGASAVEKEGTFNNTDRRVQYFDAALSPPGECRTDGEIIREIARRLGYPMDYRSSAEVWDELADLAPMFAGIRYHRLRRGETLVWPCVDERDPGTRTLHQGSFTRGRGRFHALPYEPAAEAVSREFPYLLTTGRRLEHYCNGSMTRRSRELLELCPRERLEINPADARALGISEGDRVEVTSARGRIEAPCHITDRSPEGVVFLSFHFAETPTNVLTGSHYDAMAITPEYKVTAVNMRRV
jgi:formate dehydrogenase alpha subunit